jgi:hypothetical protein
VAGFGAIALTELFTNSLFSGSHLTTFWMGVVNMMVFNIGVSVWLTYAFVHTSESAVPLLIPQRWDDALMEIHPHQEAESLIPMFEHMVDRAFSRAQDGHA